MITPEQVKAILGRIDEGKESQEDIQRLNQAISSDKEMEFQLGETIVNIGKGQGIHIGNKLIQQVDVEAIREILKENRATRSMRMRFILVVMGILLGISYVGYNQWQSQVRLKDELNQITALKKDGQLEQALTLASEIPQDNPNYQEAQTLIRLYSEEILDIAIENYQKGEVDDAFKSLKAIPENSSHYQTTQEKIQEWNQELQQNQDHILVAQKALREQEWNEVIKQTNQITLLGKKVEHNTDYWNKKIRPLVSQAEAKINNINQQIELESAAKNTIHSISQAQQDYFITHDSFTENIGELNLLINLGTKDYKYEIKNFHNLSTTVAITAITKHTNLRSFVGVVADLGHLNGEPRILGDKSTMTTLICQTIKPSLRPPNLYVMGREWDHNRVLNCPPGAEQVSAIP